MTGSTLVRKPQCRQEMRPTTCGGLRFIEANQRLPRSCQSRGKHPVASGRPANDESRVNPVTVPVQQVRPASPGPAPRWTPERSLRKRCTGGSWGLSARGPVHVQWWLHVQIALLSLHSIAFVLRQKGQLGRR
jgi:hypothetical protein